LTGFDEQNGNPRMATYLITGGLGFIGGHLAEAVREAGHAVRILDDLSTGRRENAPADCEVIIGDVAGPSVVAKAMAEVDGDNSDVPLTEMTAPRLLSAYGADKLGCELHADVAARRVRSALDEPST
jgi:uncharacterized protein YbjT (DUF2867 family)